MRDTGTEGQHPLLYFDKTLNTVNIYGFQRLSNTTFIFIDRLRKATKSPLIGQVVLHCLCKLSLLVLVSLWCS